MTAADGDQVGQVQQKRIPLTHLSVMNSVAGDARDANTPGKMKIMSVRDGGCMCVVFTPSVLAIAGQ